VQDEERSETTFQKAMGLIGDLADSFPGGELREQLLTEWIINNLLKGKPRLTTTEAKRTLKWAKEVRKTQLCCASGIHLGPCHCRWSRKLRVASTPSFDRFISFFLSFGLFPRLVIHFDGHELFWLFFLNT
jgi:hypothetical protein